MRILFVGAGATGGYCGGRLAEAGKDVTVLVRPRRAAALTERGVEADAVPGDFVAGAERLGVPVPLLSAAYTNLAIYGARRGQQPPPKPE